MRNTHRFQVAIFVALTLLVAAASPSSAQSPSPIASRGSSPSADASATTAAESTLGPIAWTRVTKGKDFNSNPAVYGVGQLPDGRLVIVGSVADGSGQPSGAAWSSNDGSKWSRFKIKAPKGSAITAIEDGGSMVVATGQAGDDTGLVWTSSDGTKWSPAAPTSGVIYDIIAVDDGFVGAGLDQEAAIVSRSTDGVAWQQEQLAPAGRALHVARGPDDTLVVAGVVIDSEGRSAPTVWSSAGGSGWTETPLAGFTPGNWSVPAMALTPVGYVLALTDEDGAHVLTSPDGVAWQEMPLDDNSPVTTVGTAGGDAVFIGRGRVLRSSDGVVWTSAAEPSFEGWTIRALTTLTDGRLFAAGDAGDAFGPSGSVMAAWLGAGAPAPSGSEPAASMEASPLLGPMLLSKRSSRQPSAGRRSRSHPDRWSTRIPTRKASSRPRNSSGSSSPRRASRSETYQWRSAARRDRLA